MSVKRSHSTTPTHTTNRANTARGRSFSHLTLRAMGCLQPGLSVAGTTSGPRGTLCLVSTLGKGWSTLDLQEAHRLYQSGLSFEQLGRKLGYSKSYLARRFRAAGISVRPSGRPLTSPAPEVDVHELVLLRESGSTYPNLADRYGISVASARARYYRATGRPLRSTDARSSA